MEATNVVTTSSCSRRAAAVRLKIQSKASSWARCSHAGRETSNSRTAGRALTKKAPLASTTSITTAATAAPRSLGYGATRDRAKSARSKTWESRMTSAGRKVSA